jgi:hypothetical protein
VRVQASEESDEEHNNTSTQAGGAGYDKDRVRIKGKSGLLLR